MNASNGSEEVKSLFEELVKIYPEVRLTEELFPDLVLKPKERTTTSRNVASVKLRDSIQSSERFNTCLNTLRKLDSAERDAKRLVYFSCLQGQVLKRLKYLSGEKNYGAVKDKSHSCELSV